MKGWRLKGVLPLAFSFLPLLLGVVLWWLVWRGYALGLRAELRPLLPPGTAVEVGGFPYRLEAEARDLALRRDRGDLRGSLVAKRVVLNRVPWQRDRQVVVAFDPDLELAVPAISGADAHVSAPALQASLHLDGRRIVRLSIVWATGADIRTGLLPEPVAARHFEVHFRELPAGGRASLAEAVVAGQEVRFGAGAPLRLDLAAVFAPSAGLAGWLRDSVVSVDRALLADDGGEVARFAGTVRVDGAGGLVLDGRIETVCPATVRAAVAGVGAAPERRAHRPQTLAIAGRFPGGLFIPPRDAARPLPPVRGQEPFCPRLR